MASVLLSAASAAAGAPISTAGAPIRAVGAPIRGLVAPVFTAFNESGALDLQWTAVPMSRLTVVPGSTVHSITIDGLAPESEYKFRVRTVGKSGATNDRWSTSMTSARTRKLEAREKPKQTTTASGCTSDTATGARSAASSPATGKRKAGSPAQRAARRRGVAR